MFKRFIQILLVLSIGTASYAQDKKEAYYLEHQKEILSDAQAAFKSGQYDRAIKLCDWQFIIVGDHKADALKEKATRCQALSREMNALAAAGRLDEAKEKAEALLKINPDANVDLSQYFPKTAQIEMKKKFLSLPPNDLETLQIDIYPSGAISRNSITWLSSNTAAVTVDSYGTIETREIGESIITACYGESTAACKVQVVELGLSESFVQIYVGDKHTVNLDAFVDGVEWKVDNPDIIDVRWGKEGAELVAKNVGTALITAEKGRASVSCSVEVENEEIEAVDMGFPSGVKWASRNIGSRFKYDIGDTIYSIELGREKQLGPDWSIPCSDDFRELYENCERSYIKDGYVNGTLFTSKINGNSLFFPSISYDWGEYWVESDNGPGSVEVSKLTNQYYGINATNDNTVLPIRPVYTKGVDEIKVSRFELLNVDVDNNLIGSGLSRDVAEIRYLAPKLNMYSRQAESINFCVKIIGPDGDRLESSGSPEGYSYSCDCYVPHGYSVIQLTGWGSNNGLSYSPGQYKTEIWNKDRCLCETEFVLYSREINHYGASEAPIHDANFGDENKIDDDDLKDAQARMQEFLGPEVQDYVDGVDNETVEEETIPFQLVEEKPKFQGGDANEFSKWVNQRLEYPEIAKENGVQGRVLLQFTVNANGSVSGVKVLRGVDPSLDKEAVRVVSMSPRWTPGKQRNRKVKVTYTFPVIFQLK